MNISRWLTLLTFLLLIWQLAATKGTLMHIIRWALTLSFSVTVVVINTFFSPLPPGLMRDPAFIIHIAFGTLFFGGLIYAPFLGAKAKRGSVERRLHRGLAYFILITWILSMAAAPFIRGV